MKREEYKHLLNYFAGLMILAVQFLMYAYIWYHEYVPVLEERNAGFWRRGNWAVIGMYILVVFFFTKTFGGYRIGYLRIMDVCFSQILAVLSSNVVAYLQICMVGKDYMELRPILALTAAELAFILPWVYGVRFFYVRLYPPRKMIVIYGGNPPDKLIAKINTRDDKYDVCATENADAGYDVLCSRIMEYEAVVLCSLPEKIRSSLIKFCFANKKRTYISPEISDIIITGSEKIHLFDTPLFLARNQGLRFEQRAAKRLMDLLFSVAALILTLPFMAVIAVCIKLYDGGPVFYTQERITKDGRPFRIIKFRSMRVDSEAQGARLACKEDDRITPVGRFLRAAHLDELPQLVNILKGEMSFVGPRPERAEIAAGYQQEIPEFSFRLQVKAGLTGYAQVYGKYNTTPYDKLKLDLTYIESYSVWLDLKLMVMTFKVMFQKENTEGVEKDQRTAADGMDEHSDYPE